MINAALIRCRALDLVLPTVLQSLKGQKQTFSSRTPMCTLGSPKETVKPGCGDPDSWISPGISVLYLVSINRHMSLQPLEEVFDQGRELWKDREVPEASQINTGLTRR